MENSTNTMSEEQKTRLGDKYISESTTVTDNDTQTKYRICKIEGDGILLEQASSFSNHPKNQIKVDFDEFLRKYDNKEIAVSGYTHEVPDQIILHQVVNDIIYCTSIGKLNNEIGELATEEQEFKSGGVAGTIKLAKNGYVKDITNQFGKRITTVQAGDMIYKWHPSDKTYKSVNTASRLNKANLGVLTVLKSGGGIKNQYEGMTPEEVWTKWTPDQRTIFWRNHAHKFSDDTKVADDEVTARHREYEHLQKDVKKELASHVADGQYKKAGKIEKSESELQEELSKFVGREVLAVQSFLVEKLLKDEIIPIDDIKNYYAPSEEEGEEEQSQDIMEWWLISDWLKEKLLEEGEPIIDNDLGTWWGRTTSGQAIYMDGVIRKIYRKISERKTGGKAGTKTADEQGYNGWKNYETWNVKLWLDNDSSSYKYWQERTEEIAKNAKKSEHLTKKQEATITLADELKEYHEENNPLSEQANVYTDLLNSALSEVDWIEIAENLLSEKMKYGGEMKSGGKAPEGITKTEVKGNSEDGYHFNVYYNENKTAGFVSASYKTEKEAEDKLEVYKATGKYDYHGTAEMKTGGEAGREFKYLKITPKENGLEISLTPEGMQKAKEDGLTYHNAHEYFEHIQGNSEYIYHPNMGEAGFGMTGAEGITDGYYPSEDSLGEYEKSGPDAKVYWFPNYELQFWGDILTEEGVVLFPSGDPKKEGGKVDVTKNFYRFRQASPKDVTACANPQWAKKVAEGTKKGAEIITCKKDGKWMIQSILIPKQGVKQADAKRMANEIKSKFIKKKKALGGIAETCTCDEIHTTIEGLKTLRDTTQDASESKRYSELIDSLN